MISSLSKWIAVLGVSFIADPCATDVIQVTNKPVVADTPHELIEKVIGRDHVWRFDGYERRGIDDTSTKIAQLAYRPFRSSEQFCRTYVTTVHSPGWFCEEDCSVSKDLTYDIETEPYIALVSLLKNRKCDQADLEDFFALKENLHDREVAKYLELFEKYFERWQQEHSEDHAAQSVESLSVADLEAVDVVTENEMAVVRFVLRHPRFAEAGHRLVFDLKFRGQAVVEFTMDEQMP